MGNINELIASLEACQNNMWEPATPSKIEDIIKIEEKLKLKLPEDYKKFLLYAEGGQLQNDNAYLNIYDLHYLQELNPDPVFSLSLPGMIFFANDGGDYVLYLDPGNRLGRGDSAIYGVEMGVANFDCSMHLADNIYDLFEKIFSGEDVLNRPYLKS